MTLLAAAIAALLVLDAAGYTFSWGTNAIHQCGVFVHVREGVMDVGLNTIEGNPFEFNRWLPVITRREPASDVPRNQIFATYLSVPWIYEPWRFPSWKALTAVAVAAAFLWHVQRRNATPGLCNACGYCRDGLSVASACPECGTPAAM